MDAGLGVQGAGRSLSRSRGLPPKGAQRPTSGGRRSGGAVEDLSAAGKNGQNRRRGAIRGACLQFARWPGEQVRKPTEVPDNSYTLNPTTQPHSAVITDEHIALVIYSGETDEVKSVEIVDIEPAPGKEAELAIGDDRRG